MFDDQTSSNIVWWPNMLMLKWVAKRLKLVSLNKHRSNYGYKPLSKRATHARAPNMFDTAVQTNKTSPIKHENKRNVFKLFDRMFDGLQIFSNTTNHHQTRWPNSKMFGHQTMFDGVWSPNISRLDRPLGVLFKFIDEHPRPFYMGVPPRALQSNHVY